jgi:hypothetical protein
MAAFSFIPVAFHMIRSSQLIALIVFDEEYKSRISLWSYLQLSLTSCLLGQNIFFNTLFWNTFSQFSSLNATDQVSCSYKITGKLQFCEL